MAPPSSDPGPRRSLWVPLALGALFLLHAASNGVWLSSYGRPPHYDQAYQVTLSLDMADTLAAHPPLLVDRVLDVSGFYPPLLYVYTAPFYWTIGRSVFVARLSELGFFLILLLSVYGLGRRAGDAKVGLLAAAMISLYPIVFGISRYYTNDFPLLAMVALSLERLWASDGFRRFGPSIHFGLVAAGGFLVKWTFICFILPPVVYVLVWEALRLRPERWVGELVRDGSRRAGTYALLLLLWLAVLYAGGRALGAENTPPRLLWGLLGAALLPLLVGSAARVHRGAPALPRDARRDPVPLLSFGIAGAFLVCLVVAFPWYARHTDYVMGIAGTVVEDMSALRGMPEITRPEAWTEYAATLLSHQLHLVLFVIAALALAWALWRGGWPRVFAILFAAQYVILSAIRHKDPRYFMPALPLLAVLSAWWVLHALPRRARATTAVLVVVFGVAQMGAITWGSPLPREVHVAGVQVWKQHGYGSYEGLGESWPLLDMVQTARRHAPQATSEAPATIALLANSDALHYEALNVYARVAEVPVRVIPGLLDANRTEDEAAWNALRQDFILSRRAISAPRGASAACRTCARGWGWSQGRRRSCPDTNASASGPCRTARS